jgi:hypothetical protein
LSLSNPSPAATSNKTERFLSAHSANILSLYEMEAGASALNGLRYALGVVVGFG